MPHNEGTPASRGWSGLMLKPEALRYTNLTEAVFDALDAHNCIPYKRLMLGGTGDAPPRLTEKLYSRRDLDRWAESLEGLEVQDATKAYKQHVRTCQNDIT